MRRSSQERTKTRKEKKKPNIFCVFVWLLPPKVHLVGSEWGDETQAFLTFIDGLVQIGGSIAEARNYAAFKGPKWRFLVNTDTAIESMAPVSEMRNVKE